ncbi:MAG TPA: NOG1 family protein [Candidatus Thermoplasmatota archaeon]|nr:NOG1 family protein [Candidatus Thermoplasmatota archaeon]
MAEKASAKMHPRSFARIPTIMTADEIIDSAFRRASRITVPAKDPFPRLKQTEQARVRSVQNGIASTLQTYVKRFPSFDQLPPFYRELIDLTLDLDRVRKSLGALDWAWKRVNEVGDEAIVAMKKGQHAEQVLQPKQQAYGRISSLLHQVDGDLRFLDEVRQSLKKLPVIEMDVPTVVVAGYPNVGKSSLVRRVSTGTPEVAHYPFTTKGVVVGHFDHKHVRHQIIDTPGLLDRPLEERNPIELQALQALRHLADVIVFLVDPSEHCGYTLEAQLKLLEETRGAFPDAPLVVAESKADLKRAGVGEVSLSTETGEGVEALMALAISRLKPRAR